jgi:hypothetical protein
MHLVDDEEPGYRLTYMIKGGINTYTFFRVFSR